MILLPVNTVITQILYLWIVLIIFHHSKDVNLWKSFWKHDGIPCYNHCCWCKWATLSFPMIYRLSSLRFDEKFIYFQISVDSCWGKIEPMKAREDFHSWRNNKYRRVGATIILLHCNLEIMGKGCIYIFDPSQTLQWLAPHVLDLSLSLLSLFLSL